MRLLALLAVLLAGAGPGAALAANPKATSLAKEAEKAYKDNRYEEAAALLKQAWAVEPNPKFLYNMARALDQAGKLEGALEAYRQYVALPSDETDPEIVGRANKAMDRLRRVLADQTAQRKIQDAEKQRLSEDVKSARATAEEESARAKRQRDEYEAKDKAAREASVKSFNGRKVGSYVTGGVAIVGFGLSLGFGLAANGSRAAFTQATTVKGKRDAELATRTQATVADVSLLVGVVAAITTVILYPKGEEPQGSVSVVLAPVNGGAIASLGVRF